MNQMSRLLLASLTVLAVSPAFASEESKIVQGKEVAQTTSGRTIVRADGSLFIELTQADLAKLDAQMIYEKNREQFRAIMQAEQEESNPAVRIPSQRAGLYRNPNIQPPVKTTAGISLTDGSMVGGEQYIPTREQRLINPGTRSYVMTKTEKNSDLLFKPGCRNPHGMPDVQGINSGGNGCFGMVTFFKKLK